MNKTAANFALEDKDPKPNRKHIEKLKSDIRMLVRDVDTKADPASLDRSRAS